MNVKRHVNCHGLSVLTLQTDSPYLHLFSSSCEILNQPLSCQSSAPPAWASQKTGSARPTGAMSSGPWPGLVWKQGFLSRFSNFCGSLSGFPIPLLAVEHHPWKPACRTTLQNGIQKFAKPAFACGIAGQTSPE